MNSMVTRSVGALGIVAGLLVGGVHAQQRVVQLSFGVYTSDKPSAMYGKFRPVIEALENEVAAVLERPADIELRIFSSYEQGLDALVKGEVDFARFGPASYILAKRRNPRVSLVAMETVGGKKRFQGMIVVRADSPIQSVADLRGRSFAFGDENSTIGRYLVQDELQKADLFQNDLGKSAYLGRHDKVFRAVEFGDFDAGSLKEGTFAKLNKAKQPLRVLHRFDNVTKPWVARAGLPADHHKALQSALLALKSRAALKALKVSGFAVATDEDYALVRRGMQGAQRFAVGDTASTPPRGR